jgi:hypothetical protein
MTTWAKLVQGKARSPAQTATSKKGWSGVGLVCIPALPSLKYRCRFPHSLQHTAKDADGTAVAGALRPIND